jgi:hypothetical protein
MTSGAPASSSLAIPPSGKKKVNCEDTIVAGSIMLIMMYRSLTVFLAHAGSVAASLGDSRQYMIQRNNVKA